MQLEWLSPSPIHHLHDTTSPQIMKYNNNADNKAGWREASIISAKISIL